MRKIISNIYGYSIYELSKATCLKHGLEYPCLQAFYADEQNPAYIKPQYSECDFETVENAIEWCKEYAR